MEKASDIKEDPTEPSTEITTTTIDDSSHSSETKEKQSKQQEEEKKSSIKDNLMTLINQLDNRATNPSDRRQLEMIKQMVPLYEKHDFWDTQPVPKQQVFSTSYNYFRLKTNKKQKVQ